MTESTSQLKLHTLTDLFPGNPFQDCEMRVVSSTAVPAPYDRLLVHDGHMTVTLERHHASSLALHIIERRRVADEYSRSLTLCAGADAKVVLAGIMRICLATCEAAVREAIVGGVTPLGRILIENEVLRRIEPHAYLHVELTPRLRELFRVGEGHSVTYGRVARIICAGKPVVELLEIVAPE